MLDRNPACKRVKDYLPHKEIGHETEYARRDVHTQNIDANWSNLKWGVCLLFHHVSEGYLPCYLSEFDFRFNRRKISGRRAVSFFDVSGSGRLLWYRRTPQPEDPHA